VNFVLRHFAIAVLLCVVSGQHGNILRRCFWVCPKMEFFPMYAVHPIYGKWIGTMMINHWNFGAYLYDTSFSDPAMCISLIFLCVPADACKCQVESKRTGDICLPAAFSRCMSLHDLIPCWETKAKRALVWKHRAIVQEEAELADVDPLEVAAKAARELFGQHQYGICISYLDNLW